MGHLQIRDMPEDLHTELRRRAEEAGQSMREYVIELIRKDQSLPTKEEWLRELRTLEPVEIDCSPAELIRQVRQDREDELWERINRDRD